jgi:hypothetical protein
MKRATHAKTLRHRCMEQFLGVECNLVRDYKTKKGKAHPTRGQNSFPTQGLHMHFIDEDYSSGCPQP